jgi:hypothetical protein
MYHTWRGRAILARIEQSSGAIKLHLQKMHHNSQFFRDILNLRKGKRIYSLSSLSVTAQA